MIVVSQQNMRQIIRYTNVTTDENWDWCRRVEHFGLEHRLFFHRRSNDKGLFVAALSLTDLKTGNGVQISAQTEETEVRLNWYEVLSRDLVRDSPISYRPRTDVDFNHVGWSGPLVFSHKLLSMSPKQKHAEALAAWLVWAWHYYAADDKTGLFINGGTTYEPPRSGRFATVPGVTTVRSPEVDDVTLERMHGRLRSRNRTQESIELIRKWPEVARRIHGAAACGISPGETIDHVFRRGLE